MEKVLHMTLPERVCHETINERRALARASLRYGSSIRAYEDKRIFIIR